MHDIQRMNHIVEVNDSSCWITKLEIKAFNLFKAIPTKQAQTSGISVPLLSRLPEPFVPGKLPKCYPLILPAFSILPVQLHQRITSETVVLLYGPA